MGEKILQTCSVPGCDSDPSHVSWGYCVRHAVQVKRLGHIVPERFLGELTICTVDGCERPYLEQGYCVKHMANWKAHGNPVIPFMSTPGVCILAGCDLPMVSGQGYCKGHYRQHHNGDGLGSLPSVT